MLILIVDLKSGLEDDFGNMTQKPLSYVAFGRTPLRNSISMATPKDPGDQKLFERVCYTLILKATKFQPPTPNSF